MVCSTRLFPFSYSSLQKYLNVQVHRLDLKRQALKDGKHVTRCHSCGLSNYENLFIELDRRVSVRNHCQPGDVSE